PTADRHELEKRVLDGRLDRQMKRASAKEGARQDRLHIGRIDDGAPTESGPTPYPNKENRMREYRLIDSDAHALEAPNIWKNWLPARFQDRAPKLVKDPAGGDDWQFEPDRPIMMIGLTGTAAMRFEAIRCEGYTFVAFLK